MKVLLWHGYLLRGSGSNIYTANLAAIWRAEGHDVLLMCQEGHGAEMPFVDADGVVSDGTLTLRDTGAPPAAGRCRLARPDIGEVLPVYVYDEYEGFTAKRFVDLDEDELDHYTRANIDAMVVAIEEHRPDAIVTGHEVMGPYIAAKACAETGTRFVAKLHGSALEYAVKLQERYRDFAKRGLGAADFVAGGSNYMLDEAASVIPGWRERGRVVNPGCDIELFLPKDGPKEGPPHIAYVGKLIASKGVHNLIGALGLMQAQDVRTTIVGFGGFEDGLKELADALTGGDFDRAQAIAAAGEEGPLEELQRFLATGQDPRYRDAMAAQDITFTGRLEHGPLSKVLPELDALVVPSVVPEAFGMVAAEAAACGVLPIVPNHSGIGEVGATLEAELGRPGLLTFDATDPVRGIAAALDRVLSIPRTERRELEATAVEVARSRWSWRHCADSLLDLATRR